MKLLLKVYGKILWFISIYCFFFKIGDKNNLFSLIETIEYTSVLYLFSNNLSNKKYENLNYYQTMVTNGWCGFTYIL